MSTKNAKLNLTCVAAVLGGHGVHGAVKVKSFTAIPADFSTYGPLLDVAGAVMFTPKNPRAVGKYFTFRSPEVTTREAAEALKGTQLYVPRDALPEPEDEDEFYYADLIGLDIKSTSGQRMGTVKAVHEFGAGDMLEIQPPKSAEKQASWYHPFTKAAVPKVDVKAKRLIIHIEEAVNGRDPDEKASNASASETE